MVARFCDDKALQFNSCWPRDPWAKAYRGSVLKGVTVQLAPLTEDHVTELRRIRATPEVRARWGEPAEEALKTA